MRPVDPQLRRNASVYTNIGNHAGFRSHGGARKSPAQTPRAIQYSIGNRLWVSLVDMFGIFWLKKRAIHYRIKRNRMSRSTGSLNCFGISPLGLKGRSYIHDSPDETRNETMACCPVALSHCFSLHLKL